jgi:excisionase family DNA binding protein
VIKRGDEMELLTVKETADMLRVSQVTVRRYIASGKLAAVRVGRNIRIRREDVEGMLTPDLSEEARKIFRRYEVDRDSHPYLRMVGMIKDEGPDDYSVNHDKYLAEAYADTHEDDDSPIRNPDGDTTLTPREWMLKNHPMFWTLPGGAHEGEPEYIKRTAALMNEARAKHSGSGKPFDFDSLLWELAGIIDDGPTDLAENHDKYLADAYADNHEE